ncbi:MAG: MoxR family ATPase [Thermoflexales bacterium]|jgi:MoxR-like ATPase|nr:MoxR family ATPase [Thermoflexales bacterium]MBP8241047.1 MoxR family ATPase [Thermoflexales bacterium]
MKVQEAAEQLKREAGKIIIGQTEVFEQMLIALLARGHVLLEGVPGVAKTLAAKTLSHLIQAPFKRVQFTPDLMPSDIVGSQVFDGQTGRFYTRRGPVFTSLLLADEVNRAPAKTQSALLEAMAERQVTIEGERLPLPEPFMVLATQNPVDYEGTYPLPEAQLDRFLFKTVVSYPSLDEEVTMLSKIDAGFDPNDLVAAGLQPVLSPEILVELRVEIDAVRVDGGILDYMARIAHATRKSADLILGASPRASIALLKASKTSAAMQGRDYVVPDDVKSLALPALRHRIMMKPEAEIEGLTADVVVRRILAKVEVPR